MSDDVIQKRAKACVEVCRSIYGADDMPDEPDQDQLDTLAYVLGRQPTGEEIDEFTEAWYGYTKEAT